jgi:hypothetical protein
MRCERAAVFTGLLTGLVLLLPGALHASPITFHYQSGQFNITAPQFPPGISSLSALFTVGDLPADVIDFAAPITLWNMSDGLTTVDPSHYLVSARFTTNLLAEVTGIWITASNQTPVSTLPVGSNTYMVARQSLLVDWMGYAEVDYCWSYDGSPYCNDGHYWPADGVGTVSVVPQPVPEPSVVILFAAGLATLALQRRRWARR